MPPSRTFQQIPQYQLHLFLQGLIWTSVLKQYPIFDSSLSNDPGLQVANGLETTFQFFDIVEVIDQKCAGEVYLKA